MQMKKAVFWDLQGTLGGEATGKIEDFEPFSFAKEALLLSEKFDTPVILRLSTRVSHSQSIVEIGERGNADKKKYEKNIGKFVMMPGNAIKRHVDVENRLVEIRKWSESCKLNKTELNGSKIGVITAGISYQYAKEALGDSPTI